MILNRLKFINFRQFSGEQEIVFASDPIKNITVIHGENGSGKTTILNAITWCLYKEFSPDFEQQHDLLSRKVFQSNQQGTQYECSVELEFTDCDIVYQAKRAYEFDHTYDLTSGKPIKETFELFKREKGEKKPIYNESVVINKIIPRELHSYFFFNGERIDKLAKRSNSSELRKAIKTLLGVTILERTITHLGLARKHLVDELNKNEKIDSNLKEVVSKLQRISDLLEEKGDKLEQHKKNIDSLKKEEELVVEQIGRLKESDGYEREYKLLTSAEATYSEELKRVNDEIRKILIRDACCSFMEPVYEKVNEIFEKLNTTKILPSSVKEDFIKKLLEQHRCMCNRELQPSTEYYESVRKYLDYAINKEVDENISIMKTDLHGVNKKIMTNPEKLKMLMLTRSKLDKDISDTLRQLDELKKKLKGMAEKENLQKLVLKKEVIERRCEEEIAARAVIERDIPTLQIEKKQCEQLQKELITKDHRLDKSATDIQFADSMLLYTQDVFTKRIGEIRIKLTEKINRIFRRICKKDYYITMDDDFKIDVVDSDRPDARPVGKSTGENQITSLSFVGSILEFSREIGERPDAYGNLISKYGGQYPLVMDSPFGSLDQTYSEGISEILPSLAQQVVIMVSSSQWRQEVSEPMSGRIGKRYNMCFHSSKAETSHERSISGYKKEYFLSKSTDGGEFTEIEELI